MENCKIAKPLEKLKFIVKTLNLNLNLICSWIIFAIILGSCSQKEEFSLNTAFEQKGIDQEYIQKLKERGTPEIFSGKELKYIGMPIGGLTTGQVYLGGDGQLWYWDIFNINRIDPTNTGAGDKFYLNPMTQDHQFEQGFAIKIKKGITSIHKELSFDGFSDITFRGEYPMAKVTYRSNDIPITIQLEAFSPFIPTKMEQSDFPAVVMQFTLKNDGDNPVDIELFGWLQNTSNLFSANQTNGKHLNKIVKSDNLLQLITSSEVNEKSQQNPDHGNMSLSLLNSDDNSWSTPKVLDDIAYNLGAVTPSEKTESRSNLGNELTGAIGQKLHLAAQEERTVSFVLSWYFPNVNKVKMPKLRNHENLRYFYSQKFNSAGDVALQINKAKEELFSSTKKWTETWYDSSLPYWFLDRTFINTSILASTSCYRFDDLTDDPYNEGRFYALEGVYLGEGTCTHVFHYEQAFGRLFPNTARKLRDQIDFGLAWDTNGYIKYRAEHSDIGKHDGRGYAIDGHAGTILRSYREHTMSKDAMFLNKNWRKIKMSIEYLIAQDSEETGVADGIIEGFQYHTLDRPWYGKISWITSLYNATLQVGFVLANEIGDTEFALYCKKIAESGSVNIISELYNGEFFINTLDKDHLDAPNTNIGCHIDQVMGQGWALQAGLPRVLPKEETVSALRSIFKYNYQPDVGKYLDTAKIQPVRFYAHAGEGGTMLTSFPNGGTEQAPGKIKHDWDKLTVGYFSENMTGFTYQAAGHMIAEGLVDEGLIVIDAIHKRYGPLKRNPYNEIEYGNHYIRAMASYGAFVSASGFTYHGPKGEIGFDPKISPEDFKSAFVAAEGWGSFTQERSGSRQSNSIALKYGKMTLTKINLVVPNGKSPSEVILLKNDKKMNNKFTQNGSILSVVFKTCELKKGEVISIMINF